MDREKDGAILDELRESRLLRMKTADAPDGEHLIIHSVFFMRAVYFTAQ